MKKPLLLLFMLFHLGAYSQTNCPPKGYFYTDFSLLYWKASMKGLYFSAESETFLNRDFPPPKEVKATAKLNGLNFAWDPGVQVALGYRSCCYPIDIGLIATYYTSTSYGSRTLFPDSGEPLHFLGQVPLWMPSFVGNLVVSADADWTVDYGILDFRAKTFMLPFKYLILAPKVAFRGAWIEQDFAIHYNSPIFLTIGGPIVGDHVLVHLHNRFRGIGLNGGIDFSAPFCNNRWTFFGGMGASLIYGESTLHENLHGYNLEEGIGVPVIGPIEIKIPERFFKFAPHIETELGLSYHLKLPRFQVLLSASYLFNYWADQNEFINFVFSGSASNPTPSLQNSFAFLQNNRALEIQGLIFKATFLF